LIIPKDRRRVSLKHLCKEMEKKTLFIGLFGLGTVGKGVAELLLKRKNKIENYEFVLKSIVVKNLNKKRNILIPSHLLTSNPEKILKDEKIDTIIEVIGGITPAKDIIMEALKRKKNVVTANKALLAKAGSEIFKKAQENNCYLGVRASNIASYRLIESLSSSPSEIQKLVGIFNGTCNYILTEMEKRGEDFSFILKEAQKIGYTEQDPSNDIDGYDTAHKLAVLLGLTSGYFPPLESFFIEGIRRISYQDIIFTKELGYRIKLLAIAQKENDKLEIRVHPALISRNKALSRLEGIENGIEIRDEVGLEIGMQAPGAGKYPTATAILEDLISIARGKRLTFPQEKKGVKLKKMEDIITRYYLKFEALDKPRVLSEISGILGNYNISIQAVLQKGERKNKEKDSVPVIMLTHKAKEKNIQKALQEINELFIIKEKPLLIRVEEGIF